MVARGERNRQSGAEAISRRGRGDVLAPAVGTRVPASTQLRDSWGEEREGESGYCQDPPSAFTSRTLAVMRRARMLSAARRLARAVDCAVITSR